jgi:hypothetical protein
MGRFNPDAGNDDDQDGMGMFPSAANPLTVEQAEQARANPELLKALAPVSMPQAQPAMPTTPGISAVPSDNTPEPSAIAAGATGGAGTPQPQTATDYGLAGLASLKQNLDLSTKADQNLPTSNAQLDRLQTQRDKLATPAPLYDPTTGKMLSQTQEYDPATGQMVTINPKASTGSKIWRGVRGGLVGALTGGIPGAVVGALEPQDIAGGKAYSAPSGAYTKAEERRGEELAATDKSASDALANWKEQVDAAGKQASEFRANAGLGKDLTTGSTGMQNAATEAANAATRAKEEADTQTRLNNETPQAKAALTKAEFDQRISEVANMPNLSPLQRTLYILNGKVPDPDQPNEAEFNAAAAARALTVFKMQHGGQGPQTLDDFNSIQAAARGTLDKGTPKNADDQVSSIVADATGKKQEFADKYQRLPSGSYLEKGTANILTGQQFQTKLNQFANDANEKLAKLGAQIDLNTGQVVQRQPAGATAPTATPTKAPKGAPPISAAGLPDGTQARGRKGEVWITSGGQWTQPRT